MNATELLAMYERVANAPDAILKLRRFILELAVRGKLAPLGAADDTTALQLQSSVIPKGLSFALPSGWVAARLDEVATCLDYMRRPINAAEREKRTANKAPADLFPYYGATQQQGWIDNYIFDEELLLLGEDGIPFFDPYRAKAYLVSGRTWVNNHAHVFRCRTVLPRFLVHYLNVFDYTGRVVGATRAKLNQAAALDIPIPVPPMAEQRRIIAKVDELMALCDQLEAARTEREAARDRLAAASLARLNALDPDTFQTDASFALNLLPALSARPNQVKQLRQTILNLAVRGKLVPQDLTAEGSQVSTPSVGRPADIPSSWRFEKLESLLSEDTRNGYSRRPDDAPDGTPILRISAGTVRRDGVVAEEEHKLISGIDQGVREQYGVRAGDLLACRFNGNKSFVGRLTLFEDYLQLRPIYPDKLIRVRIDPTKALATFLRHAGESDLIRTEVEAQCATTVGNWGISASNLKSIHFPVPPLAEQHHIVARVDELMALCDQLEASLIAGESSRGRLLVALLHEALEHQRRGGFSSVAKEPVAGPLKACATVV